MRKARLIVIATGVMLAVAPLGYDKAVSVLEDWEGYSNQVYLDPGNHPTIGNGLRIYHECDGLQPGECSLDPEQSKFALEQKVYQITKLLEREVTVPLTENQRAALVSFTYNVGNTAFINSTLLKKLNAGCYKCVPAELAKYNKVKGKKSKGLVNRRNKEIALWKSLA